MVDKAKQKGTVYVIGAGFSKDLGYPLIKELLPELETRLSSSLKKKLKEISHFHFPKPSDDNTESVPNIEQLLSAMLVNEQLFDASRSAPGKFRKDKLVKFRRDILLEIASWFHSIHKKYKPTWFKKFGKDILKPEDTIISFNWDLELDRLIFGKALCSASYGYGLNENFPTLLKPHGSLNWYAESPSEKLKQEKTFSLSQRNTEDVRVFNRFRNPKSSYNRTYMPLVIPPTFIKDFHNPVFGGIWSNAVAALSKAKEVCFIGFSLAQPDYHARFILRCGFHNQIDGKSILPKKETFQQGLLRLPSLTHTLKQQNV